VSHGLNVALEYTLAPEASGHLATMTMPLGMVSGGIAISGLYDLEPIRLNYLNGKLGLDEADAGLRRVADGDSLNSVLYLVAKRPRSQKP